MAICEVWTYICIHSIISTEALADLLEPLCVGLREQINMHSTHANELFGHWYLEAGSIYTTDISRGYELAFLFLSLPPIFPSLSFHEIMSYYAVQNAFSWPSRYWDNRHGPLFSAFLAIPLRDQSMVFH